MLTMTVLTDVAHLVLENKGFLCLAIFVLYIIVVATQSILIWYKLRHFKGPFWAAFSKWWLVQHAVGGSTFHLDAYEVCKKYGMIGIDILYPMCTIFTFSCRINCTHWS